MERHKESSAGCVLGIPRGFLIVAESKDQMEDDGEGEGSQRAHLPLIAIVGTVRQEKLIS